MYLAFTSSPAQEGPKLYCACSCWRLHAYKLTLKKSCCVGLPFNLNQDIRTETASLSALRRGLDVRERTDGRWTKSGRKDARGDGNRSTPTQIRSSRTREPEDAREVEERREVHETPQKRAKSLQLLVHGEPVKQAISFMIALNGLEKNGAWEGGRDGGMEGWREWCLADGQLMGEKEREQGEGGRKREQSAVEHEAHQLLIMNGLLNRPQAQDSSCHSDMNTEKHKETKNNHKDAQNNHKDAQNNHKDAHNDYKDAHNDYKET
ncbi:hypothetical protein EYF80_053175 [Liparis tanakae]|uniref:Uncharacterized protein n=1 Tax=Liparis tanakae TaxID=230148 RepID=A0A4Z2F6D5_9TELE|nr:hypothetical protein EYF80_053175 [Liparis tanakae]